MNTDIIVEFERSAPATRVDRRATIGAGELATFVNLLSRLYSATNSLLDIEGEWSLDIVDLRQGSIIVRLVPSVQKLWDLVDDGDRIQKVFNASKVVIGALVAVGAVFTNSGPSDSEPSAYADTRPAAKAIVTFVSEAGNGPVHISAPGQNTITVAPFRLVSELTRVEIRDKLNENDWTSLISELRSTGATVSRRKRSTILNVFVEVPDYTSAQERILVARNEVDKIVCKYARKGMYSLKSRRISKSARPPKPTQ